MKWDKTCYLSKGIHFYNIPFNLIEFYSIFSMAMVFLSLSFLAWFKVNFNRFQWRRASKALASEIPGAFLVYVSYKLSWVIISPYYKLTKFKDFMGLADLPNLMNFSDLLDLVDFRDIRIDFISYSNCSKFRIIVHSFTLDIIMRGTFSLSRLFFMYVLI